MVTVLVHLALNDQVWDRDIILTALKDYYDKDMELLLNDIVSNFTDVSPIFLSLFPCQIQINPA